MVVLIIIGVVVTVGLLSTAIGGFFANRNQGDGPEFASPVIVTVNGTPIRLSQLQATLGVIRQQTAFFGISDPVNELRNYYDALRELMGRAVLEGMASQRGIVLSDAQAMQLEGNQVDSEILQLRLRLEANGTLFVGATNQEFQEAFLAANGITATEYRKRRMEIAQNLLDDPLTRQRFIFQFLVEAVTGSFALEVIVTEEELRAAYDEFVLDVIPMNDPELSFVERETLADEILEKLNDGADFAEMQAQYVDSPTGEPVRKSRRLLEISPDLADLLDLKPGEVAKGTDFGIVGVYKLRAIEPNIPEDFEQNSKPYIDQYKLSKGAELADAAITEAQENIVLEWVDKGYEFAYNLYLIREDESLEDDDARIAKYYEAYSQSLGLEDDPDYDLEPLIYARYYAHTQWYRSLDAEGKAEAAGERAEIVDAMLTYSTSFTLYFALIDLYETVGDVSATGKALISAARMLDAYNPIHESFYDTIRAKLSALRGADAIGEDDVISALKVLKAYEDDLDAVREEQEADRLEQEAVDKELAELAEPEDGDETDETSTGDEDDDSDESEETDADEGG
ncbi:MAG: peptidyl-prolyl cis-trans isomerase [Armatimonadetes bacterium]|nr:peptidyl-prolyl cis-trans isomerase [Armatimonadota bacterium]